MLTWPNLKGIFGRDVKDLTIGKFISKSELLALPIVEKNKYLLKLINKQLLAELTSRFGLNRSRQIILESDKEHILNQQNLSIINLETQNFDYKNSFGRFLQTLYRNLSIQTGSKNAQEIIKRTYQSLENDYGSEQIAEIISIFPSDTLSIEIYKYLNRAELEERMRVVIESEKTKSEQILRQNKELEDTKKAMINLLEDARSLENQLKSEKENVEKKVEERTRELQEEQARLESSINSIKFGFILTNNTPELITINSFAKHLINQISTDEKVKKFSFGLEFNTKYSMDQIDKMFSRSFPIKSKILESIEKKSPIEFKELELNGRIMHIFIAPIVVDEKGELKIIGTVILIEDITEEKILDRSKDEFFSIASHELRTPLTSIKGNASMLKEYYADKVPDNTFKEMLDDIHESSIRLIEIVNDFLNVSRLEQGKILFKKEKIDISLVINEAIRELEGLALQKGLYLRMEKPKKDSNPFVFADMARTKEVISNLLSNSIKYTQKGGITISLQTENGHVKISVADTGRGIAKEQQNLLFRKFQQAGESILTRDTTKGTGLGLYISKMMIEGMGGKIYLEKSEVEKGSVFVFELPLVNS